MLASISRTLNGLPALSREFNPIWAIVLGFLFGGIGLGIYLRSWRDFAIATGGAIALALLIYMVAPEFTWLLTSTVVGLYGYFRVLSSNERRTGHFHAPRTA